MGHKIFGVWNGPHQASLAAGRNQWWPLIRSPPGRVSGRTEQGLKRTARRYPSVSFIPHSICLSTAMFNDILVILMHIGDILGIIGGKQHKTTNFWHHFPADVVLFVSVALMWTLGPELRGWKGWLNVKNHQTVAVTKWLWINNDQYLYIAFLMGWTSISQLFWCELQGYKVLTHCHVKNHQTFAVTKSKASIVWGFLSGRELFTYIYFIFWRSLGRATWGPSWLITRTVCLKILLTYGNFQ